MFGRSSRSTRTDTLCPYTTLVRSAEIAVAVVGANVQVVKAVQFGIYDTPVGLGTVLFSSTYLCTDILMEHYGREAARRGVLLGFAVYLFWTVLMVLTMGDRKSTRLNSSHSCASRMPSSS